MGKEILISIVSIAENRKSNAQSTDTTKDARSLELKKKLNITPHLKMNKMKLFWDIDETLIHTRKYLHKQYTHDFEIGKGDESYFVCVRPCAKQVIDYSREVFGADNVYILTTSVEWYARSINKKANWGFDNSQIISREIIHKYSIKIPSLYGSETLVTQHPLANKNNLLIDNLRPEHNREKTSLMLINPQKNYLTVEDYYGNNLDDDIFRDTVIHFMDDAINRYADNLIQETQK